MSRKDPALVRTWLTTTIYKGYEVHVSIHHMASDTDTFYMYTLRGGGIQASFSDHFPSLDAAFADVEAHGVKTLIL